jgi:alpha-beta hydrolase superfamily lysophospholipase
MAKPSLFGRLTRWAVGAVLVVVALIVAVLFLRPSINVPASDIELWHTEVPPEMSVAELDAGDWPALMAAEARARAFVATNVTARLPDDPELRFNRYAANSPINSSKFAFDWNRSFILEPTGDPRGVVVVVHGLTDSPFSLRHLGQRYQAAGWIVIAPRMPGHGTVPAGLTKAIWQDWAAATRLAMREAKRRAGDKPIDIVGYSNGGALAVQNQLGALADPRQPRARRIILMSPMIGLTEFARFAGVAGWPAAIPGFANAAWMGLMPEFNPYKYNSFPINAARESYRLTAALQSSLDAAVASGTIKKMPPILTFQSVADSTVSTSAVVTRLYDILPANGSELVLFDVNRAPALAPLLRTSAAQPVTVLVPPRVRRHAVTIVTNGPSGNAVTVTTAAGATTAVTTDLGMPYPAGIYSLSHIAMPFPANDGLYGNTPDPADVPGINLGGLAASGERGVLSVGLDTLLRLSWNPFYDYMNSKIDAGLPPP